jgi:hypothetical protein
LIVVFDEHVPPSLVDAFALLSKGEAYRVDHVRRRYGVGVSDAEWLAAAGAEGAVVVSCDHHIMTRPHEIAAWRSTGVVGFVLPKAFNQMGFWDQAAFLARWWPTILELAGAAVRGDVFAIPHKWTPRPVRPRQR